MRRTPKNSVDSELIARRLAQVAAEIERTQIRPVGTPRPSFPPADSGSARPATARPKSGAEEGYSSRVNQAPPPDSLEGVTRIKAPGRHSRRPSSRSVARADPRARFSRATEFLSGAQLRPGPLGALVVAVLILVALVGLRLGSHQTEELAVGVVKDAQPLLTSGAPRQSPLGAPSTGSKPGSDNAGSTEHTSGAALPAAAHPGEVVVDVAGKVRRPGIAVLPAGSRVVDAIRAAGGAKRGVDLTSLNLARPLTDGEQILVGVQAPTTGLPPGASGGAAGVGGTLINLNQADQTALETLPGVGPVTAQAILAWRSANGAFTAVAELLEVDGIGDATLAKISPHVTV